MAFRWPPPFALYLQTDGQVAGPRFARRMNWLESDQKIEIIYENSLGQSVVRQGHLAGPGEIVGMAQDNRGREWRWTAERSRGTGDAAAVGLLATVSDPSD